jgi:hypothetical protein
MIKITQKLKNHLWWLIITVDYDYSRITVAEHEINGETLTLWLEDKHDFKNSLEECLQVDLPLKQFAKVIKAENLNSYEGTKTHPKKALFTKPGSRSMNPSNGIRKMPASEISNMPAKPCSEPS